mmetsp:Transcript_62428/g.115911  ORF Transcript_62428/g.115911 Transcript_62428/m.115911 type:complete len:194 (-) Transcript_62428:24-605(-)
MSDTGEAAVPWSVGRSSEKQTAGPDLNETLARLKAGLTTLKNDADFQGDLKDPEVLRALMHWSGRKRLAPEDCEDFQDNWRVMQVYRKIQQLQHTCGQAGLGFPLDLVLEGKDELPVPGLDEASQEKPKPDPQSNAEEDLLDDYEPAPLDYKRFVREALIWLVVAVAMGFWMRWQLPELQKQEHPPAELLGDG